MASSRSDVVKAGFWYCNESRNFQLCTIDPRGPIYFTHLFCAFADLSGTHHVTIPTKYLEKFSNFTASMTKHNKEVRTLMSIGGEDSDPSTFALMARQKSNREVFIKSSISLARTYHFHGLDLCWSWKSHPNTGPTANDMNNLDLLLVEWRQAVMNEATTNNKIPLLLSASVFYTPSINSSASYPAEAISRNLDWINVRAYDFYDPYSSPANTGPPAALYNPRDTAKCVDAGISNWIQAGVPANKLVLGLSFGGWAWALEYPDQHQIFAPARGPALIIPNGFIFYRNIKELIARLNFTPEFDGQFVTDYCYSGKVNTWIGYTGVESIKKKIQYANQENQLRGYFAWHVCGDDLDWTLSRTAFEEWDRDQQA